MKKMKVVIGIVLFLIVLTALFITYTHFRTYTVGKDLKFSEINRVYCMSSMHSSDYGYIYDQYSAGKRTEGCYVETDLFDPESGEQVKTTVRITEDEYLEILRAVEGSKYVRQDAPDKDRMDGYMDEQNQSADMFFDRMPDGPYELRLSSDARAAFISGVKELMDKYAAAQFEIHFTNKVCKGDVWIIDDTKENRGTSIWGTATIKETSPERDYSVKLYDNKDNTYLFRMIDEDDIYYEANALTLDDQYSVTIYRKDDEYREVFLIISDEEGNELQTLEVFNAAL